MTLLPLTLEGNLSQACSSTRRRNRHATRARYAPEASPCTSL